MGHHGVIIVSDKIAVAFDLLYYLERAAKLQVGVAVPSANIIRSLIGFSTDVQHSTARCWFGEKVDFFNHAGLAEERHESQ